MKLLPSNVVEWMNSHAVPVPREDLPLAVASRRRVLTPSQVREMVAEAARKRLEQEGDQIREEASRQVLVVRAELGDALAEIRRLRAREEKLQSRVRELEAASQIQEEPRDDVARRLERVERLFALFQAKGNQASRMIDWEGREPDREGKRSTEPEESCEQVETLFSGR